MKLRIRDSIPEELLTVAPPDLAGVVPAPTLFHLAGRRSPPLFVSVMLHGNEPVGLEAIQHVLARHRNDELPRSLSLFFGNVAAARAGVRHLPGEPDYNRVWPGSEVPPTPEHLLMEEVVAEMRRTGVFASIDVHNNTGTNPHYACVNSLDNHHLQLASLFSPTVVYFTRPKGVQSAAFASICPAITIECGKIGDASGVEHAAQLIEDCLHLAELPTRKPEKYDIHLYHTVAILRIPPDTTFAFGSGSADLVLPADLDRWNFAELDLGTEFGRIRPGSSGRLEAIDADGNDCMDIIFETVEGRLRLRRRLMPSMLTLDCEVIRQDCLGYLMESIAVQWEEAKPEVP